MPIATPEQYGEMLDAAKAGGYAYPAVNVTSSETLNAALRGFAEAKSDGIVQVSTGGAEFASGSTVKDMVTGAKALAAFAREIADGYDVLVALHTDHCIEAKLDGFLRPLLEESLRRRERGEPPLFNSHMFDGLDDSPGGEPEDRVRAARAVRAGGRRPRGRVRRRRR